MVPALRVMVRPWGATIADRYIHPIESSLATYFMISTLCFLPVVALVYLYYNTHKSADEPPKGCRQLGLRSRSNLADEHNKRYSTSQPSGKHEKPVCKVKSLWIFPVKSCRGIELEVGDIINTGIKYDRLFSFAQLKSPFPVALNTTTSEKSKHRWKFMTQRDFPTLAHVKTEIWVPDTSLPTFSLEEPDVQNGGVLIIKYPYDEDGLKGLIARLRAVISGNPPYKSVRLPLDPTAEESRHRGYTLEEMEIWKDSPLSLNMASTIGPRPQLYMEELQAQLGCSNPLALFRVSAEHHRKVYRCAPREEQLGWQPEVGFGDAYPLHILNLASVRDVGSKVGKDGPQLSALRFRPNIIFTGLDPYAEDSWKRIKIGDYEYHVSCRTVRCLLPNVDPQTGIAHKLEPYKTLRSFRCIDKGASGKACLGMQMVPATAEAKIRVGDTIEILETGKHYYIKQ